MLCTGGEGQGSWVMPDILVNVMRPGEDPRIGVVREAMVVSARSWVFTGTAVCFIIHS